MQLRNVTQTRSENITIIRILYTILCAATISVINYNCEMILLLFVIMVEKHIAAKTILRIYTLGECQKYETLSFRP